jgi:hypothetical protein
MKIAQERYQGWTKKTFGSAEHLLVRVCKDYYTYKEQERMKEVLMEEHVAQISSSRKTESIATSMIDEMLLRI